MALPMDEQRILDEMERMLAADDPRLAARLAAFGQPGFGQVLRTKRARATMSIMVLVLIAAVAAVIYMMSSFRPGSLSNRHHQSAHSTPPAGRLVTSPASGQISASAATTGGSGKKESQSWPAPGRFCAATFCGPFRGPAPGKLAPQAHAKVPGR